MARGPCINGSGAPKVKYPNEGTARWFRDNIRNASHRQCVTYQCRGCRRWHIGALPRPRFNQGLLAPLWRAIPSLAEVPVDG